MLMNESNFMHSILLNYARIFIKQPNVFGVCITPSSKYLELIQMKLNNFKKTKYNQ